MSEPVHVSIVIPVYNEEGILHAAVVDLLLERGADFEHRNENGATALAWAKRGGFDAIERALRRRGAKD